MEKREIRGGVYWEILRRFRGEKEIRVIPYVSLLISSTLGVKLQKHAEILYTP